LLLSKGMIMPARSISDVKPLVPSKNEIKLAKQLNCVLAGMSFEKSQSVNIMLKDRGSQRTLVVPLSAFRLLLLVLAQMAEGNAVTIMPVHVELTTQESADLLNVSRPYFIRLLEAKKIPFRKVGTRRKILFQDVMSYKVKIDQARRKVLDNLTEESQKLHLGY
jgi:excisionase family DNA binding protein